MGARCSSAWRYCLDIFVSAAARSRLIRYLRRVFSRVRATSMVSPSTAPEESVPVRSEEGSSWRSKSSWVRSMAACDLVFMVVPRDDGGSHPSNGTNSVLRRFEGTLLAGEGGRRFGEVLLGWNDQEGFDLRHPCRPVPARGLA